MLDCCFGGNLTTCSVLSGRSSLIATLHNPKLRARTIAQSGGEKGGAGVNVRGHALKRRDGAEQKLAYAGSWVVATAMCSGSISRSVEEPADDGDGKVWRYRKAFIW